MTDMQAWLDQGRTLTDRATEGPWRTSLVEYDRHWGPFVTGGAGEKGRSPFFQVDSRDDAEFIADARTRLPQALDALQAVLDLHKRNIYGGCISCVQNRYPCPTVEAIQRAITTPNYLEENDTLDPPM